MYLPIAAAASGMEGAAALSLDCEDMFKEITKKLYGEEAVAGGAGGAGVEFPAAERLEDELRPEEHITAWGLAALMQHGVPPPGILQANFTPRTDPGAEDRWAAADEPLGWAASRVAAYNPAQRLFKCCECECVGFLARVAEHWLGTHAPQRHFHCPLAACGYSAGWARAVRLHLAREHHADAAAADQLLRDNPALGDLTRYLQRLKAKVDAARHERRVEPAPPPPPAPEPGAGAGAALGGGEGGKRYACNACPYATDRRDLFTRHENIHRDEKPFHCYLCHKQFNRADHVKKHFLRMHRELPYDLNRIRRQLGAKTPPAPPAPAPAPPPAPAPVPAHHYYVKPPPEPPPPPLPTLEYRVSSVPAPIKLERAPLAKAEPAPLPPPVPPPPPLQKAPAPAVAGTAAGSGGPGGAVRRKGERRYACCYCAWSGADNWCLKRHLNTHLKPFACALCEYKAARAERLATHVHKVHNKQACARCPFLADDAPALHKHLQDAHHIESRNLKVPGVSRSAGVVVSGSFQGGGVGGGGGGGGGALAGEARGARRAGAGRPAGAARLFGYLEASDGSGDEYEPPLPEFSEAPPPAPAPAPAAPAQHFPRDKENAAPLHLPLHHDHCLRY
ncbi:protein charlatan isoform X2 [Plutella xylostella]|uniref:protein charlatan isoform X2 n=1 Tax=Plutella xylostella TaxID=51655 RepID=UPI0020324125|nr:protein charlatan isoform X2 [Plutella xylostella]